LKTIIYTFRMWRVLRLAFASVLAIALPLQGVTAATMMVCGMAQHRPHSTDVSEHAHHVESGGTEGHSHHAASEAPDHASHGHASGETSDGKSLSSKDAQKCSACASCCVGVAVPVEPLSFAPVRLPDQFAALVPSSVAAFVTEGPERPPRLLLA
jgi:hypothetical protein